MATIPDYYCEESGLTDLEISDYCSFRAGHIDEEALVHTFCYFTGYADAISKFNGDVDEIIDRVVYHLNECSSCNQQYQKGEEEVEALGTLIPGL